MKKFLMILMCLLLTACQTQSDEKVNLSDILAEWYDAENMQPQLFLPGVASTPHFEHSSVTFSEDEILWSRFDQPLSADSIHNIFSLKYREEVSEAYEVAWSNLESEDSPFYFDDKIYYHSKKDESYWIYYYDLVSNEKHPVDVDTDASIYYPSINDDMMVFNMSRDGIPETQIMCIDDESKVAKTFLSDKDNMYLNITPFINPSNDMILFASVNRLVGSGASDLYVAFKSEEGIWSEAIHLPIVNTVDNERFPSLSPDGKYLFFISNRKIEANIASETEPQNGLGDIYWIDASFIYALNPYK